MSLMTDNVERFVRNQRSQNPLLPFIESAQFITAVNFISIAVSADIFILSVSCVGLLCSV